VPIRTIDRALDCVREAFYVARAERKPVVLSVPLDLQTEEFPYLPDYTPSMDLLPRAQVLRPDPAVVDEVVAMVAEAERPVVIGGRGATWSGAKGALESLAQESGALLATTLLGKGLFEGNPFALDIAGTFATDLGRELFAESDLVIAAGAGLGHYTTEGGYLFPMPRWCVSTLSRAGCGKGCEPPTFMCRPTPGRLPKRLWADSGKRASAAAAGAATRSQRRLPQPPRTQTPSPIRLPPARSTHGRLSKSWTRQCRRIGISYRPARFAKYFSWRSLPLIRRI
jgi:hypothetical protein